MSRVWLDEEKQQWAEDLLKELAFITIEKDRMEIVIKALDDALESYTFNGCIPDQW